MIFLLKGGIVCVPRAPFLLAWGLENVRGHMVHNTHRMSLDSGPHCRSSERRNLHMLSARIGVE